MNSLLINILAVAPLSTMAAVAISQFCSLRVISTQKCEEQGFILRAVEMLHVEIESYAEVVYIANCCKGTHDAAKSGTLTENPAGEPWHWRG